VRELRLIALGVGLAALLAVSVGLVARDRDTWQPAVAVASIGVAVGLGAIQTLRSYQFTAWIVTGAILAMIFPAQFLQIGPIDLRNKTLILIIMQLVMFGMGTQMKLRDLAGLVRMPYPVLIGIGLQFTVMPLVGFMLATVLGFSPEIAAGIVLIGSCSSGLASNVMTFIARGNLPLSIALTSCATLLAPVMTPLWMKILAGRMIPVDAAGMMMEIIKLVLVPIGAAMLADYLEHTSSRGRKSISALAAAAGTVLILCALGGWHQLQSRVYGSAPQALVVLGFLLGALVAGVAYYGLVQCALRVTKLMPICSMLGIIYVTSVTVAAGRDQLLVIGPLLLMAVIAHNSIGYLLGYWLSRAFQLDASTARTVALEVGLQNGGMATALAASLNQLSTLGLAAAVFNPWMNFSGSMLANYWRRRPVAPTPKTAAD
jgi:BASS family bile acid:Na+ symporter